MTRLVRGADGRARHLLFDGSPLLPSAVYADPADGVRTGRDAVRSARIDPARYEPNPKRRIDESTVLLGDRAYAVTDLIAHTLRRVCTEAVRVTGAAIVDVSSGVESSRNSPCATAPASPSSAPASQAPMVRGRRMSQRIWRATGSASGPQAKPMPVLPTPEPRASSSALAATSPAASQAARRAPPESANAVAAPPLMAPCPRGSAP